MSPTWPAGGPPQAGQPDAAASDAGPLDADPPDVEQPGARRTDAGASDAGPSVGDTADTNTRARLAGVVLAGGRSTRFGRDKALATLGGRTLLDRAVSCLRGVCDGRVLVSSGDGVSRPLVADGQIADVVVDGGPLAGIAAGLLALRDEAAAVAVLAVDHVSPSAPLLGLLAQRREEAACATVIVGEWLQPLHAVWSTAVADELAAAVTGGVQSPTAWLAGRDDVVVLDEATLRSVGLDPSATRDADVPDDLRL